MQLLEKYNLLLGEEPLQIRDFTEVLEAGLSAADVAVIPPGYDSVTIGDIERTRLNHIRILFFIGVNDGIIPKAANAGGIISEYERELLAEKVELAPGAREQAFIQRFYLYRNHPSFLSDRSFEETVSDTEIAGTGAYGGAYRFLYQRGCRRLSRLRTARRSLVCACPLVPAGE